MIWLLPVKGFNKETFNPLCRFPGEQCCDPGDSQSICWHSLHHRLRLFHWLFDLSGATLQWVSATSATTATVLTSATTTTQTVTTTTTTSATLTTTTTLTRTLQTVRARTDWRFKYQLQWQWQTTKIFVRQRLNFIHVMNEQQEQRLPVDPLLFVFVAGYFWLLYHDESRWPIIVWSNNNIFRAIWTLFVKVKSDNLKSTCFWLLTVNCNTPTTVKQTDFSYRATPGGRLEDDWRKTGGRQEGELSCEQLDWSEMERKTINKVIKIVGITDLAVKKGFIISTVILK